MEEVDKGNMEQGTEELLPGEEASTVTAQANIPTGGNVDLDDVSLNGNERSRYPGDFHQNAELRDARSQTSVYEYWFPQAPTASHFHNMLMSGGEQTDMSATGQTESTPVPYQFPSFYHPHMTGNESFQHSQFLTTNMSGMEQSHSQLPPTDTPYRSPWIPQQPEFQNENVYHQLMALAHVNAHAHGPGLAPESLSSTAIQPQGGFPPAISPEVKVFNINNAGTEMTNTPLHNMIDATKGLIQHYDASSHVSTFAERDALKKLKDRGCLFIKGRTGTGKTRMGIHLIDTIAKEMKRVPILLTSAADWNLIPKSQGQKGKGKKYVVMIDDIFGSNTLVQSTLDEWEKMFEFMWPSVENGHIYLVLTSRSDVSSKCHCRVKKYHIMKNIQTVELDEGNYCLRENEKMNLIQKYCGRLSLTKEDIEELCQMKTLLGFPQCCVDLARTKNSKERNSGSAGPAHSFLAADLHALKENDTVGYFVLLLILMKGSLDVRMLERPSKDFKAEVENLSDVCISQESAPSCRTIKDKAAHFCGFYLVKTGNEITFRHESVYNAVFFQIANTHLDLFLSVCPAKTLVKYVRTARSGTSRDERSYAYVDGDLYVEFTQRIIEVLLGEDGKVILDHPCFHDDKFVDLLLNRIDQDTRAQIVSRNIGEDFVDLDVFNLGKMNDLRGKSINEICQMSSVMFKRERIFVFDHLISLMVLKGLSYLAESLLFRGTIMMLPGAIMNEILTCAIYANDTHIVAKLLDMGVCPSASSLRSLCCIQAFDHKLTEKIFNQVKWNSTCDMSQMLSLAVQNGNTEVVSRLVGVMAKPKDNMKIFGLCLTQFMFQCSNITPDVTFKSDIFDTLLNTGCPYEYDTVLCLAAGHNDTYAWQCLLAENRLPLSESQYQECLKHAALFGSPKCFEECLQTLSQLMTHPHGLWKGLLLNFCARSTKGSHSKMEILLEVADKEGFGVDIADKKGNTPLHFAALRGDPECVNDLIKAGADADIENEMGITPLECAAVANNTDCLRIILHSDQIVNKERTVFKYCFHEPSRKVIIESFANEYRDLRKTTICPASVKEVKNNIDTLQKCGFNVDKTDSEGQTCLFHACHIHSPDILSFLCKKAKIDIIDIKGRTVVHEAAEYGNFAMVRFLCLRRDAKIDSKDNSGQTVIHAAAASQIEPAEKLQFLIGVKSDLLKEKDNIGRTALFPAVETGDAEVVDYLTDRGLSIKESDKNGISLIQLAEKHKHEHLQKRLSYRRLSSTE